MRISHTFSFENRQAGCARSLCEGDPESGYPFYFNRVTGASSWDEPKVLGLRDDEDDQAIQTTLQVDDVHYDDELLSNENVNNTYDGQEALLSLNDNSTLPETETKKSMTAKSWVVLFKENDLRAWQCICASALTRQATCRVCNVEKKAQEAEA